MLPSEQEAYDICTAAPTPPAEGLLASEPVLQSPAGDSMGVAFAVNGLSVGFAADGLNIPSQIQEGMFDPGFPQPGGQPVSGVAFGNAAQIQGHAFC